MFTNRCGLVGIEVSNGSRGDCFDNAAMESFHASLKKDLIHRRSWPTKAEARTAVFEYIEAFYNRRRRHSRRCLRTPVCPAGRAMRVMGSSGRESRGVMKRGLLRSWLPHPHASSSRRWSSGCSRVSSHPGVLVN
jgi:hypothetical protein